MANSTDTSLKSLNIEPQGTGLVQEENNSNVYRVKVDNNTTSLKINAIPNNDATTVSIEGNDNFVVGTNKVTIKVQAPSGETSNYIIYVRRASIPLAQENVIPNVQEEYEENQNFVQEENKEKLSDEVISQTTENEEDNLDLRDENIENEENIEEAAAIENQEIDLKETNINDNGKSVLKKCGLIVMSMILIVLVISLIKSKTNRNHR